MSEIDFTTQVLGFDLETQGNPPEYALQPWRAPKNAWVSAAAFTRGDVSGGHMFPHIKTIELVLTKAADKDLYVCGWNVTFDCSWLIALGLEDLAFRIKWLDSMLLWRHLVVEPEGDDVPKHKRKSYSLESAMHEFFPDEAGFKEFKNFQTQDPEELKMLLFRCTEDTRFAVRLGELFWSKLTDSQRRAALIEARCIPQVARANVKGLLSSREHAERLRDQLISDGEAARAALKAAAPGLDFIENLTPKETKALKAENPDVNYVNLGSPVQLASLLFDTWGLPCDKETKSGNRSTDKYVLYELAFKDPRAKLLKEVREAKNNCTKYPVATLKALDYNGDGYVRPGARIFSTYCVPGNVEVLTRQGWVRLDEWEGGDIAQAHTDGRLEFLPASQYYGGKADRWVAINHNSLKCLFTHNHTVPFISQKYCKWATTTAGDMLKHRGSTFDIPVSGHLEGISGKLTELQMRILCMAQADGWFSKSGFLKFTFKKTRKISRAVHLLTEAKIVHRVRSWPSYPDRVEITVPRINLPAWLTKDCKELGPWLLNTSPNGLRAFVDEVVHWDGHINADDGVDYASSIKTNAEWVDTLAHLTGFKSAVHAEQCGIYVVHISSKKQRAVRTLKTQRHLSEMNYSADAYCTTTQTGFWLARSNGSIFVTGNSSRMTYSSSQKRRADKEQGISSEEFQTGIALHQWKRGKEFRRLIRPPEGYGLAELDFAGQEFGWMAVASKDETMLALREPGEDAHSYMGAQIAGIDYRELISLVQAEDEHASYQRKLGKFSNLSFQYRVGSKTALMKARTDYEMDLDETFIKQLIATYKSTFPGVPNYWRDQICKCRTLGYAETFAGRRVQLTGSWSGRDAWQMESSSINYPIQGTGGDQKYLALAVARNLLPKYGGYVYYELHDGLFFIFPLNVLEKAAVNMRYALSNLPYKQAWGVDLPITFPVDAKISAESWGDLKGVK